jgi:hypothetical protein
MMKRKKKASERYCDRCGEMVSDGGTDFEGWPNFWGVWLELKKQDTNRPKLEIELAPYHKGEGLQMVLTWPRCSGKEKCLELCRSCVDTILEEIEKHTKKGT